VLSEIDESSELVSADEHNATRNYTTESRVNRYSTSTSKMPRPHSSIFFSSLAVALRIYMLLRSSPQS
jgi:hypothetical protein